MSNKVKGIQLGISFGAASNRLRKLILFNLLKKHNENYCYRCNKKINNSNELSIEHKKPWLYSKNPVELFFDIENIAFSHLKCNIVNRRCQQKSWGISKFKGAYYDKSKKRLKRWQAKIQNGNKIETIGRFFNEIDAAKAYDVRAKEIFGNKAVLNFE